MRKFEVLEHKADLKIRAFGKTKEELFLNMLSGMQESMKPEIKNKKTIKRKIKIKSLDLPSLLVDFLSEVLYLIQTNREIYTEVKFDRLFEDGLEAKLFGKKVERFSKDIKAATYHQLDIHENSNNIWEATVLFDI